MLFGKGQNHLEQLGQLVEILGAERLNSVQGFGAESFGQFRDEGFDFGGHGGRPYQQTGQTSTVTKI